MNVPLLKLPQRSDLISLLPGAARSGNELLVPHGPAEVKILHSLGIDVPSSVIHYDWNGWAPFAVQRVTVEMLVSQPRSYILSSMGTGKTKCVLWAFDHLRRNHACNRMLVVAPLSTLRFVWGNEILTTCTQYKFGILHGSRDHRMKELAKPYDIYIINHDGFKIIREEVAKRKDIDVVVFDELAAYRNRTDRTKFAIEGTKGKPYVWGLTGAPTPNAPTDVYWQAKLVSPHTVPMRYTWFRDELMVRVNQFKWLPKTDAVDRALRVLQPSVRYTLDDVTELPEFVARNIEVDLSERQLAVYKDIKNNAASMLKEGVITAVNAGAVMIKLLQISLGWVYGNGRKVIDLKAYERMQSLLDLCQAAEHKTLVYVPYIHALHGLADFLRANKRDVAVVSGDTPSSERGNIFNAFQSTARYTDLLAHPACVAHGLTLTAADTVIWYGPITSSEIYEQANARIRRVGQKHRQLFLHLQSTAVERKLYSLLINKVRVQDQLLSLIEEASRENL